MLTATSDNCVDAFVTGKAAMFSNGMWALSGILEKNPDMADNIGFAPYPSFMPDGVPVVLVAEDSGYSIYVDSPNKEAAVDFLNFLFSAENQKKYSETLGSPSAFTGRRRRLGTRERGCRRQRCGQERHEHRLHQ